MPLKKLSKAQFDRMTAPRTRGPKPEYVAFLKKAKPGQLGKASAEEEGVTKQMVKNRINTAAKEAGVKVKYHRAPDPDLVVFEVLPE
jgi:hypothetical protein